MTNLLSLESGIFKKSALMMGLITAVSGFALSPAKAQDTLTEDDVRQIIQNYIADNPGIVVQAMEDFRTQQQQEEQRRQTEKVAEYQEFFKVADLPRIGPEDAKITVVEFFDYNCGYCKRALPDIQAVMDETDDVEVVFIEHPILSESSREAAKWALAAHNQGKYFEYHAALMEFRGTKNERAFIQISQDLDLDVEKMKADVNSEELEEKMNMMAEVTNDIGIRGTPAFIVGTSLFPGYMGEDGLLRSINSAREQL